MDRMPEPTPSPHHRVLQFGTGRFLRGFADAFFQDLNDGVAGPAKGGRWSVTAVESSGSGNAARLRDQDGRYRLLVRGLDHGLSVDEGRDIAVIERTIDASHGSDRLLDEALDPRLVLVVSNTTESGYLPNRFPARLAAVLEVRARGELPGVTILPCELIEENGRRLREQVIAEARGREVPSGIVDAIADGNAWAVTLVDRIATIPSPDDPAAQGDPFAVVVEPYASWVIEAPASARLPAHPAVSATADVAPFALRKIRILNGAHTALVARTRESPVTLVRQAMEQPDVSLWLEDMLREEIVPALGERIVDGDGFAETVLERFRNPFQDHRLADIAVGHAEKLRLRLVPTYHDHVARFGRPPRRLAALLAEEGALG
jgi:tagaturonate reductase